MSSGDTSVTCRGRRHARHDTGPENGPNISRQDRKCQGTGLATAPTQARPLAIPRCGRVGDQVRSPTFLDGLPDPSSREETPMRTRIPRGELTGLLAIVLATALMSGVAADASGQTPYVPYYGKNQIRYDNFRWHIYTTDHFEIYYYPEIKQHLERVAGYAESAYQQISADLRHDLPTGSKVPLILFKTHSEFEQQNVAPGAAQEGVLAFAEPTRQRMVMPIDEPSDLLYGLIVHELTHQFEFDIIPQSLIRRNVPLWVNEGLSDYERGIWSPMDL